MLTNKKRTLVTILGIIISVAMFTAVTTGSASILDFIQRLEMAHSGYWHVEYQNVTKETADIIREDRNTESLSLSEEIGYGLFPESMNEEKPYVYVMGLDNKGMEMMNVVLIQGRFPERQNEIVIPSHMIKYSKQNYQLGDKIEVELGKRLVKNEDGTITYLQQDNQYEDGEIGAKEEFESSNQKRSYTIVGIIERPNLEHYNAPGFTLFSGIEPNAQAKYHAKVYLDKVNNSIFDNTKSFAKEHSINNVIYNQSVLKYYGVSKDASYNTMILNLEIILIVIIMVGSISLIYNSFAISISERTKQFGMLSSVGTTKKQKMHAVLYEGFLCGLISIPAGVIAGLTGIGVTFWGINPMFHQALQLDVSLNMVVSIESIMVAILVSIITILISAYLPARKASIISAMEAIRQQKDIKITRKTVKTRAFYRNLFGLEGELALKNLKRNKKRYRVIVLSLGISIVLFISVNVYTHYLTAAVELSGDSSEGDISISNLTYEEVKKILPSLKELGTLRDVTAQYNLAYNFIISEKDSKQIASKQWLNDQDKGKNHFELVVTSLEDTVFDQYAKSSGFLVDSEERMKIPAIVISRQRDIVNYTITDINPIKTEALDQLSSKVITLYEEEQKLDESVEFDVVGSTDQLPLGVPYLSKSNSIRLIIPESRFASLMALAKSEEEMVYTRISCNTNAVTTITAQITEIMDSLIPLSDGQIYNMAAEQARSSQMMTVFNVFAYGFIALISLISIANICNTIATSFAVRRSEFAMLKSVGMTPQSFKKMIVLESMLFGIKALIFGLPIGVVFHYFIHKSVNDNFTTDYTIPYHTYIIAILFVFMIVTVSMLYSTAKTRKDSIIDGLKSEII